MWILLFHHQITTSYWLLLPFVLLLTLIASGTVFFPKFWHENYKSASVGLGLVVAFWYIFSFKQPQPVVENFSEYVSFICLILSLYIASGGIYFFADFESKPLTNVVFLLAGALLTNLIGTTGASVLLIRPYMRLNRYRLKPYHIIFFIFFVSNLGGLLTPIGDPPLFIGFLKGVPFFWTLKNLLPLWMISMLLLAVIFYLRDRRNTSLDGVDDNVHFTNKFVINGKRNFIWLGLILLTVFLDPNIIPGMPTLVIAGKKVSFIREVLQLLFALGCYLSANKHAMQSNRFDFEPVQEVAFLFFGIFLTMIPAIQFLDELGHSGIHPGLSEIFWLSGAASGALDNAPSYLNFLTLSMSVHGFTIESIQDVINYASGAGAEFLAAISVSSVFFGAFTYIGNGPNFMIKSIAEQNGIKMPGFFRYITHYSVPFLLPLLVLIWILYFRG